jgi:hypothetical protein
MSTVATSDPRGPSMSDEDITRLRDRDARRGRIVRGVMLGVALLYVGVLLLAPLAGIVFYRCGAGST